MSLTLLPLVDQQAEAAVKYAPCSPLTSNLTVFDFNDFHGRINNAAALFTPVAEARAADGADKVVLISAGDNIGGSTFESASQNDNPTVEILNAIGIDASAAGNHEFDLGWDTLKQRQNGNDDDGYVDFKAPLLASNIYTKGTTEVPAPLKPYTIINKGGVRVAIIGGDTPALPSLVSPAGIQDLEVVDPVETVNAIAKDLRDNDKADVIIAAIHEGAADGTTSAEANAAIPGVFSDMYNKLTNVDLVLNGHTHQAYAWKTKDGAPIVSAASYGERLGKTVITIDTKTNKPCGEPATGQILTPPEEAGAQAEIAAVTKVAADATKQSDVVGASVIGSAADPITLPNSEGSSIRDRESEMTNAVAQFFYDALNKDNPEFIGMQNPGGTRADIAKGDITYKEAALVLPFANSLMTSQITGAQFKTVLEQQWQRDQDKQVPSRPFLRLGLSKNVRYTYDESRPEGDRITGIWINDKPIDPAKLYTVGSGSFLIAGGDNFWELANAKNVTDTGTVDLTGFVDWVKANSPLKPDYTLRGVSVKTSATEVKAGDKLTITAGVPQGSKPVANDTVDLLLNPEVTKGMPNTSVTATLNDTEVGTAQVSNGQVKDLAVTVPASTKAGDYTIELTFDPTGLKVSVPVKVTAATGSEDTGSKDNGDNGSEGNGGSNKNGGSEGNDSKGDGGSNKNDGSEDNGGSSTKPSKLPSTGGDATSSALGLLLLAGAAAAVAVGRRRQ